MRRSRIILTAALGSVVLLALVAATLLYFVDANVYKSRLEATASGALGMDVNIDGRIAFALFPGLHITLQDVHIRNRDADVLSAKEAQLRIELLPLLRKEIRIERIALKEARISIEKDRHGHFNFEKPERDQAALPGLDWPNVSLSQASFVYTDAGSGYQFETGDCSVEMERLHLAGNERSNFLQDLSFTAELTCRSIRSDRLAASQLKFSVDAKKGILDLQPVTAHVYGAQGSGTIQADFSGALPVYRVRYTIPQFSIEEFSKAVSLRTAAAGPMDFSTNLSMQGKTVKQMRQTMTGQISLRGKNLKLEGSDLDERISRYESSQNFNLFDVGAVALAGPLGLVATRGYNFATLLQPAGGSSEIRTLVSDWKVERGLAVAQDVAIATKENRVALQGGLDFFNEQFDDMSMAIVDAKGCAKVRQKIHGTFKNPVVEKPGVLKSITGPALSLLKKGGDLLGVQCDVFYAGSVPAPK